MRELFWIISQKDTSVPVVDFFIYSFNRKGPNSNDYWGCLKSGCGTSIVPRVSSLVKKAEIHMHSHDLTTIIKFQMKVFIKSRLLENLFISANKLYDAALIFMNRFCLCVKFILGFAPSYYSFKTSLYRWKKEVLPNGGFLAIQNFNFNEFILPNGHNTLIFKEIEIHKIIIMSDLNFIGRFTASKN